MLYAQHWLGGAHVIRPKAPARTSERCTDEFTDVYEGLPGFPQAHGRGAEPRAGNEIGNDLMWVIAANVNGTARRSA
jgi:hypothetical protein